MGEQERDTYVCVCDACVCVSMLCYVSPCADDMPMINLWPHLYATAREIDRREGGRKDHVVRA